MVTRRSLIAMALASVLAQPAAAVSAQRTLKALHKRIGGRLGVHVLDSQSGKRIGYDDNSRYAMASTFKMLLAAALLWQIDRGAFSLSRPLPIARKDLLPTSPAVEPPQRSLAAAYRPSAPRAGQASPRHRATRWAGGGVPRRAE